jgi:SAM-dependent methyltransferase
VEKPGASIVADLTQADHIPSDTFDCIILTQTLQLLYDLRSALRTIYRILKPGGVVFVTVPGISQICTDPQRTWSDFWRFTDTSLTRLLEEVFLPMLIRVDVYGNVLSATAFLQGLVVADLKESELDHRDSEYQVIIAARAEKERSLSSSKK